MNCAVQTLLVQGSTALPLFMCMRTLAGGRAPKFMADSLGCVVMLVASARARILFQKENVCAQQSIALPHNVKHFTQPFFSILIWMESVGPLGSSISPACTLAITSCRYFSDPGACPHSIALGHLESVTKLLSPKWYELDSSSRGHYITIRATRDT